MATLYENFSGSYNVGIAVQYIYGEAPHRTAAAQSFVADSDHTIEYTQVRIYRYPGSCDPGTITMEIRAADVDGFPIGDALGTATVVGESLPSASAHTWVQFDFSPAIELTEGQKYSIVISAPDSDNNNQCCWWYQLNGASVDFYGMAYRGSWALFAPSNSAGCHFAIYGGTIPQPPEKPTGPTPANSATRIAVDLETIDWVDGGAGEENAADSYDVYFGLDEDNLVLASSSQAATEFKIDGIENGSPFDYSQFRAWRIDAINEDGTTEGDTWVFSTGFWLSFPPQRLSNYDNIEDKIWDIASQAWTNDADYLAAGGGRYKNQIVVVGHKKIYFGEV